MVFAHGGNLDGLNNPRLHKPKFKKEILAQEEGFVTQMNTLQLGRAVVQMGGGRIHKGDKIDNSTGIRFHKKIGVMVEKEAPILEYFCSNQSKFEKGGNLLKNIFTIHPNKPNIPNLFY